jgi:hypothetical protein
LRVEHLLNDCATVAVVQSIWHGKLQSPKTQAAVRKVDLSADLARMLFIGFRHDTSVSQRSTDPGRRPPAPEDLRLRMSGLRDRRAGRLPPRPHFPFVSALRNCRRDRIQRKRRRQLPAPLLLWHGIYQVKGVGTQIVLTYVLTIEDPHRFLKSREVGCLTDS